MSDVTLSGGQSPSPADETGNRFPSLDAMRRAHGKLLALARETGVTADTLPQLLDFVHRGRATGALLDDEDGRWDAQSLLDYWASTIYRANLQDVDGTLDDFDPELAPEIPDDACPYLGLYPFQQENQDIFYGRERIVQKMVEHLGQNRFLALVGPSGSGKSSVILAGLLPAIQERALPGSKAWFVFPPMVPGSRPLFNLARTIRPAGAPPIEWAQEESELFAADPGHMVSLIDTQNQGRPAIMVIDQFEELFTLCLDKEERLVFTNSLLQYLASDTGHVLVITMRSDFETFVATLPNFQKAFEEAIFRLTPMSAAELRMVIEKPAERVGLKFEKGVVDALLNDTLGEPAALPLLQFTLLKLWEERHRNRVTWESYRRLGGGRLALARSADELYDSLIPQQQETARRILLRMVRPGEGLEVTSNRIRRESLYRTREDPERIDRVMDKLIKARLIKQTTGDTPKDAQVEVAHEALVRNWPRLVDWLEKEREVIRKRLRITAAAEQWQELGRDDSALLRGALLDEALTYDDLDELEREFVRISKEAREAARLREEEARQRELETARALAGEKAKSNQRLRLLVIALALFLVAGSISAFLLIRSNVRQKKLLEEQNENQRRQLALLEANAAIAATADANATRAANEQGLRIAVEEEQSFQSTATAAAFIGLTIPGAEATAAAIKATTEAARADLLENQFENAAIGPDRLEALAGLFQLQPAWPGYDEYDIWAREQFFALPTNEQVAVISAWNQQNVTDLAKTLNLIAVVEGLSLGLDFEELDHLSVMAAMIEALNESGSEKAQLLAGEIETWRLGRIEALDSDYDDAISAYNQALQTNPFHPAIYYDRALAHAALEDYQSAAEDLDKALNQILDNYQPDIEVGISMADIGLAHPELVLNRVGLLVSVNDGLRDYLGRDPDQFDWLELVSERYRVASSTRGGFRLSWPTKDRTITLYFGENPELYKQYGFPGHEGIDFIAPLKAEIYAAAPGTVSRVTDSRQDGLPSPYGWHVIIEHDLGYSTLYAHLAANPPVKAGQFVEAGEIIGYSGGTGNAISPFLHMVLKKEGAQLEGWPEGYIDPYPYLEITIPGSIEGSLMPGWVLTEALENSGELTRPLVSSIQLRSEPSASAYSATPLGRQDLLLFAGEPRGDYTPVRLMTCSRKTIPMVQEGWVWASAVSRVGLVASANLDLNVRDLPSSESELLRAIPKGEIFTVTGPQENGYVPVRFCFSEAQPAVEETEAEQLSIGAEPFDLLPYIAGDGRQYEVIDEFGSQQRFQTQWDGTTFYHMVNHNWESFFYDSEYIYQDLSTTSGDDRYYQLTDQDLSRGSRFLPRRMAVGETHTQIRYVQFYNTSDCSKSATNSGSVTSSFKLAAYHDTYEFPTGMRLRDVIEVHWLNGGEVYFYAKNFGFVGWEYTRFDPGIPKWQAISEEYPPGARPPFERTALCSSVSSSPTAESVFSYTNADGDTYYLHLRETVLLNGGTQTIYFFSKEIKEGAIPSVPEGYVVTESRNGLPVLTKE